MQVTRATFLPLLAPANPDRIDPSAVREEFCADLVVLYTFGPQYGRRIVTHADLDQLQMTPAALRRAALEHLEVLASRAEFHGQPPVLMLSFDGLESSLLLATDFWNRLQGALPGDLVVGVPARDVVVVTGSQSPQGLEKARRCVDRVFMAGNEFPLTRSLLVRRAGVWEPFDGPVRQPARPPHMRRRHVGPQPPRQYQEHPSWPGERLNAVRPAGHPAPAGPTVPSGPALPGNPPAPVPAGAPPLAPAAQLGGAVPPPATLPTMTGTMHPTPAPRQPAAARPMSPAETTSVPPVTLPRQQGAPMSSPGMAVEPSPAEVAQYSAVPYSAPPFSTPPYSTPSYAAATYTTAPYSAVPYSGAPTSAPSTSGDAAYPTSLYPAVPMSRGALAKYGQYDPSRPPYHYGRRDTEPNSTAPAPYADPAVLAPVSAPVSALPASYSSASSGPWSAYDKPLHSADATRPEYPSSWGSAPKTPSRQFKTGPRARFSR